MVLNQLELNILRKEVMLKPYKGKNVKDCVEIRGRWYYAEENFGEARELLGRYSAYRLGWGSEYVNWDSFSPEEQVLLMSTMKQPALEQP